MFLSSRGLANFFSFCEDFTFVCNNIPYVVPLPAAVFFSPEVARILSSDQTFREFVIKTSDPNNSFEIFYKALFGQELEIPKDDITIMTLASIAHELRNDELTQMVISMTQSTTANIVAKLIISVTEENLSFASKNFKDLPIEAIPIDILKALIQRSDLNIPSEDWLFDKILKLSNKDQRYKDLIGFLDVSYLSSEYVQKYCAMIDPSSISHEIWENISKRLILNVIPWAPRGVGQSSTEFIKYQQDQPFSGVFQYMKNKAGQTPTEARLIAISCSNEESDNSISLENLIVYDNNKHDGFFRTDATLPNPYIEIEFLHSSLEMSGYLIRSNSPSYGYRFLKSWSITGYNKETNDWDELDSQSLIEDLVGADKFKYFDVKSDKSYQKFRITMTGPNSNNDQRLCLQNIEFFGLLEQK